jgi:GDP-L-fucose synthase
MNKSSKVYIAGHRGMVGSACLRRLQKSGYENIITRTRQELDLTSESEVQAFFASEQPDIVILAAAKVGGIHANNTYPAEFLRENLAIESNIIHSAYLTKVERLLFLGSTCIYPKLAPQPIKEESLLTSELEPTNEAYALAKIAGLKMCQYYRQQYGVMFHSLMPTNLYGPGDNYHPENSHVLPAFIRRFHEAKESGAEKVTIWGTGKPLREFLHVDDLAAACEHIIGIDNPPDWANVGSGEEVSIRGLADAVAEAVGFEGGIDHDLSKPDGTPRKLCDITLLKSTGWEPKISLSEGLESTYELFKEQLENGKVRL